MCGHDRHHWDRPRNQRARSSFRYLDVTTQMIWLAAVFGLVSCDKHRDQPKPQEKTPEQVKSEWGTKVQAKLEKIVAAAKAADGADLVAIGDAKPALDFDYDDAAKHPNAIAVQVEDVQSATAARPKPPSPPKNDDLWQRAAEGKPIEPPSMSHHPARFALQTDSCNHVYDAKRLLGIEEGSVAPAYWYDQLVNAKYLLVVTPGEVKWPTIEGTTFKGGSVRLHAVLVDIDTAKPLGGFETTATNSDKVLLSKDDMAKAFIDDKARERVNAALDKDFLHEAGRAIVNGIEQRWPGAKTPLDWGYNYY
jgi:hypothetical protein